MLPVTSAGKSVCTRRVSYLHPFSDRRDWKSTYAVASEVVHNNYLGLCSSIRRISHQPRAPVLAIHHKLGATTGIQLNEGLIFDGVVIIQLLDQVIYILGSEVVASATKDAVAAFGCVGDGLKILGVLSDSVLFDGGLEWLLD